MLLAGRAMETKERALEVVVSNYKQRWKIEEWHWCLKQGCAVEETQMKEARTLANQTAMKAVMAVRLVQIRDAARDENKAQEEAKDYMETSQIKAVALLAGKEEGMKIGEYWQEMAKLGGGQGKKNDGRPGG